MSGNQRDVIASINTLYGSSTPAGSSSKRSAVSDEVDSSANSRDYLCNIQTPKNELDGSYFVYVFLDTPNSDSSQWPFDPALVGTLGITAMADPSTMEAVTVAGTIPLTRKLEEAQNEGRISDLSEATVTPFLTENLHWRIQKSGGAVVDPSEVPDFAISVVSTEIQPASSSNEFPKWVGDPTTHIDVTIGRPGGLKA